MRIYKTIEARREEILQTAEKYGAYNIRIFGSVDREADAERRLGMTQFKLAIATAGSPSTIAKWEARSVIPTGTPSEIKHLCEVDQCTLEE